MNWTMEKLLLVHIFAEQINRFLSLIGSGYEVYSDRCKFHLLMPPLTL
jgi:hypothetical protein